MPNKPMTSMGAVAKARLTRGLILKWLDALAACHTDTPDPDIVTETLVAALVDFQRVFGRGLVGIDLPTPTGHVLAQLPLEADGLEQKE